MKWVWLFLFIWAAAGIVYAIATQPFLTAIFWAIACAWFWSQYKREKRKREQETGY